MKIKKIFIFLTLFPLLLFSQEKTYRVLTSDKGIIYAKKIVISKTRVVLVDLNGNVHTLKPKDVIYTREEIKNWRYFESGKEKFTDFVVVSIDSLNQQQLFNNTLNWVKETYKSPDKVIKATIGNSKIRIEGYNPKGFSYKVIGFTGYLGITYSIEISFKDGRYKFNPISASYYSEPSKYSSGGVVNVSVSNISHYYNKKGKLKYQYKRFNYPSNLESLFNDLNINLYNYIISKKNKTSIDDEW